MYKDSRIISTPISNNRLNWDERENHTIVVPSLIEGTLDDVIIGEETAIESEVDGTIIAGKGLKHFIFLKDSRVPTWIMDNHNHAFAFWHDAFWKGWIEKGSLLVHIDQHTDLATPTAMPKIQNTKYRKQNDGTSFVIPGTQESSVAGYLHDPESRGITTQGDSHNSSGMDSTGLKLSTAQFSPPTSDLDEMTDYPFNTLEEVENYTNTDLTIADFIVPALATKLLSEALMITGEEKNGMAIFSWNSEFRKRNSEDVLNHLGDYPSIVVDIDLDYFSQGFDDAKTLATTKYWIEKADIITIATSPLFIEQEKALKILRILL